MKKDLRIPESIYLYIEGVKDVNFKQIKDFIKEEFGNIKIHLIKLKKEVVETRGLLFDFLNTQKNFATSKFTNEKESCHIILTKRLFATFDENKKLHIRASIYGYPSIISSSGIVEGPAKPKEFYIYKQKYSQLGIWDIEEQKLKQKFKDHFIDYNDKRMTDVVKGYIAQALFFYIANEPFCSRRECHLFNAHWQEDLIYSQIKSKKFCRKHTKILQNVKSLI